MVGVDTGALPQPWSRIDRKLFAGLVLTAVILRVVYAFTNDVTHHPDEIFQGPEQSFRLLTGHGVVPWEFEWGIRSWLYPALLAVPLAAGMAISGDPDIWFRVIQVFLVLLTLPLVVCPMLWGRHVAGTAGLVTTGAIATFWPDFIYFSARTHAEILASACFVAGVYLALSIRTTSASRRWVGAGVLIGLAFILRFHIAPAIAVAAIWLLWREPLRSWIGFTGAAAAMVVGSGLLDWITWGTPFQSIWLNLHANIALGVSAEFMVEPWYQYAGMVAIRWTILVPIAVIAFAAGARELPLFAAITAGIVIPLLFIGHKEFRFLFPAIPFAVTLMGLGTVRLCEMVRARGGKHIRSVALGAWIVAITASIVVTHAQGRWYGNVAAIRIARMIASHGEYCGIVSAAEWWVASGGYTRIGRPVPWYQADPRSMPSRIAHANVLLTYRSRLDAAPAGYSLQACEASWPSTDTSRDICLMHRAGGCVPDGAYQPPWPNVPRSLIGHPPPRRLSLW